MTDTEIPDEVRKFLLWNLNEVPPDVCFAAKVHASRCEAWERVPVDPNGPNAWRKAHTENFWAWYRCE